MVLPVSETLPVRLLILIAPLGMVGSLPWRTESPFWSLKSNTHNVAVPGGVVGVARSPEQNAVLELKAAGFAALGHDELLELVGLAPTARRAAPYAPAACFPPEDLPLPNPPTLDNLPRPPPEKGTAAPNAVFYRG